ncbi:MAG: hypothetical protein JNL93_16255 [Pelomonas sp.]|nr:hypothetical protein [Roseateles sp.]
MRLEEIEIASVDKRREEQLRTGAAVAAVKAEQLRMQADDVSSKAAKVARQDRPMKPKPPSTKTIKPKA